MSETVATIFDIVRNSYVDGPGIRTSVFFKGCNLFCAWCHNPESQKLDKEILYYKNKCTSCGGCKNLSANNGGFVCPNEAKVICGKSYTVDELIKEILKDKLFYEASGGGVTFSGGECMLQIDFLERILKECKERGIHTAVDTAGNVPYEHFERILSYTDLFLYDLKCIDPEKHKKYTGAQNTLILDNLRRLSRSSVPIRVRIPIIRAVNDSDEEMNAVRSFLDSLKMHFKVELLPYHSMGAYKYEAQGKATPKFFPPTEERMSSIEKIFQKADYQNDNMKVKEK